MRKGRLLPSGPKVIKNMWGPGKFAQFVRTSSPYARVEGLIPGKGTYENQPMNA